MLLIAADKRYGHLETLRSSLSVVVYPMQYVLNLPIDVGEWVSESVTSRRTLMEENAVLREQNLLLRSRSQTLAAVQAENLRLRQLLDSARQKGEQVLIADLLAVELDESHRQVVLNKGSQEGVFRGQPFVDAHGVMGQIVHVGPFSSTGMLVTDVNHAIPVQINRSGLRAIATGTGKDNEIELSYVDNNADVIAGDLVVSSGLGGRFPSGYPVAEIQEIKRNPGEVFAKIIARPVARLAQAREVLLLWPRAETAQRHTARAAGIGLVER